MITDQPVNNHDDIRANGNVVGLSCDWDDSFTGFEQTVTLGLVEGIPSVPEPSAGLLMLFGLVAAMGCRRRQVTGL
jgi:hypothetical protein